MKSSITHLRELEEKLVEYLAGEGCSEDTIFDVRIVLHELIMNTLEHGFKGSSDGNIEVQVSVSKENGGKGIVDVVIEDDAPPIPKAVQELSPQQSRKGLLGGRGLKLVKTFAGDVKFERTPNGNRTSFQIEF